MNYEVIYAKLIELRKNRTFDPDEYYEKHHIWPKSLAIDKKEKCLLNQDWNLVHLTAEEHFIAHKLLTKITEGEDKRNMCFALWCMNNNSYYNNSLLTARQYEYIRIEAIQLLKNREVSEETKEKISRAGLGELRSEEFKAKKKYWIYPGRKSYVW